MINGEQGWGQAAGAVSELGKEVRDEIREEMYVWYLTTLVPLKKEGVELSLLPETKVDGKPVVGVRVAGMGKPSVRLYFDKDSGLLLKIARTARAAGLLVEKEYLYAGYKSFDGARLCTQYVEKVNGRKNNELKTATYELRKPDDSLFARP